MSTTSNQPTTDPSASSQKESLSHELKGIAKDIFNSAFGDFLTFVALFKTTLFWFFRPLSLNHFELLKSNAVKKKGLSLRYLSDFHLMKGIFVLSLIFMVIEDASEEEVDSFYEFGANLAYFIFYVLMLFVFIMVGWLWKRIIGLQTPQIRLFVSFMVYEYAVIFIIQFVNTAILGISIDDEAGIFISYLLPLLHSLYFFYRLMDYYTLRSGFRRFIAMFVALLLMAFFLVLPAGLNEGLMLKTEESTPAVTESTSFFRSDDR